MTLEHGTNIRRETLRAYVDFDVARMRLHYQNETKEVFVFTTLYRLRTISGKIASQFIIEHNGRRRDLPTDQKWNF